MRGNIRKGWARVNGERVRDPSMQIDINNCEVVYDHEKIDYKKNIYIIMNKPAGVLSASEDKARETVVDLVPEKLRRGGLFPVGRLDRDTTGLLIITDDGEFAHNCISPAKNISKRYIAELDGDITPDMIERFAEGVVLADETVCRPAVLKRIAEKKAEIIITEGRYHQVKRMFGTVGLGVNSLMRVAVGELRLPNDIAVGECREMTEEEKISALK